MAFFKDLLDGVLPEVTGCPKSVAIKEIRNSAIELCRHAPIWTDLIDGIETDADDAQVELDALIPTDSSIHKVLSLTNGGREMTPEVVSSFHRFDSRYSVPGRPRVYVSPAPNLVVVSPIPDGVYELKAAVSLTPTGAAEVVDDDVFSVWGQTMVNGALHRLMRYTSTPWGNPDLSAYYGQLFQADKSRARRESVTTHSAMSRTIKPVSFI